MTLVSSQDFATNYNKYFDLAINEKVVVKRGDYTFNIVCNLEKEQKILQPDEDLHRAISAEELLKGIHEDIRRKLAARI
jgi:hypothetical protein